MRKPLATIAATGVVAVLLGGLLAGCTKYGATLARPEEAVVVSGASLPALTGADPQRVVAFSWDGSAWHQIPVQVDERDLVNPGQVMHRPESSWATLPDGSPYLQLVYTPPRTTTAGYSSMPTYTPNDTDAGLDANDEVSFMATDAGKQASVANGAPPNVVGASVQQVTISDPIDGGVGYVYLFRSNSLTGGGAGTTGVQYTFALNSGDYLTTYRMGGASLAPNNAGGPNLESSTVVTPTYTQHLGDRWLNDGLTITTLKSDRSNILERSRYQFGPGTCGRSEDTFDGAVAASPYEGAFTVNISGPVRAVRQYLGANSGLYTMGTDVFYAQREVSTVDLHVHAVPGVMSFDDMATGHPGLTYYDDQHLSGVPITGNGGSLTWSTLPLWRMVSGASGSLVTTTKTDTDITSSLAPTGWWEDHTYPSTSARPPAPCTGDLTSYGQNGVRLASAVPCTDPTRYGVPGLNCDAVDGRTTAYKLNAVRERFFGPPNMSTASAASYSARAQQPLTTTVQGL